MSAFIVTNTHINVIVSYAVHKRLSFWNPEAKTRIDITCLNAEEIGRILMDQNVRSVGHRYDGRIDANEKNAAASYRYRVDIKPRKPVEILKACSCLDYQSCETEDWEDTLAWRILDAVKSHAMHDLPGWDAAAWCIDDAVRA